MRRACYSTLFLLLAAASYGVFAGIFMCVPVHKFWTPQAEGHCENAAVLWLAAAGMNIVMDWIVWILPMPVISQLKLPTRQRAGVMAVFALGGLCVLEYLLDRIALTATIVSVRQAWLDSH